MQQSVFIYISSVVTIGQFMGIFIAMLRINLEHFHQTFYF